MQAVVWLTGLLFAGFSAWLLLDTRVTRLETTMDNARLADVPSRLSVIETQQTTMLDLLRKQEKDKP